MRRGMPKSKSSISGGTESSVILLEPLYTVKIACFNSEAAALLLVWFFVWSSTAAFTVEAFCYV
jgi:tryptophan-rich sensory protein